MKQRGGRASIRHATLIGIVLVALGGCASERGSGSGPVGATTRPIAGGSESDLESVVAVVSGGGAEVCSGVVIGSHHVLTARICVETPEGDAYEEFRVILGPELAAASDTLDVDQLVRGEPLTDGASIPLSVAVLVTRTEIPVAPLPLADRRPDEGEQVRIVGYGDDGSGGSGVRREGQTTVETVRPEDGVFTASGSAVGCQGDAGGPALDDSGTVLGIHQFVFSEDGRPMCDPATAKDGLTTIVDFSDVIDEGLSRMPGDPGDAGADARVPDAGRTDAGADARVPDAGRTDADSDEDGGPPAGGASSDGGCDCGVQQPADHSGSALVLLLAALAVRRRARGAT